MRSRYRSWFRRYETPACVPNEITESMARELCTAKPSCVRTRECQTYFCTEHWLPRGVGIVGVTTMNRPVRVSLRRRFARWLRRLAERLDPQTVPMASVMLDGKVRRPVQ